MSDEDSVCWIQNGRLHWVSGSRAYVDGRRVHWYTPWRRRIKTGRAYHIAVT